MEVSFLKDAINRIAEMAQPFVMEVDGRKYCSANMCEVEGQGEKPLPYRVDTLDALIQLIRTEGVKTYEKLFVRVKDPHTVVVDSGYITTSREFYDRASLYQAVTDVPPVTYGRAMDAERADGGAWKLEAKRSIAAYLGGQLADLVESGNVVVMI